jgi:large subunit ribosomal protein L25
MSNLVLKAEARETGYTRGELNKYRAQGTVPGCIYGKGMESIPVFVNSMNFTKAYRSGGKIFELELDGKKHLISVDCVDTDHLGKNIMHVSFHKLSAKEKISIEVPLTCVGNAVGVKSGGLLQTIEGTIPVKGMPTDIPESIEVDVTELDVNGNIHWSDITLPTGLEANWTDDKVCVVCKHVKVEAEETTENVDEMVVNTHADESVEGAPEEEAKKAA